MLKLVSCSFAKNSEKWDRQIGRNLVGQGCQRSSERVPSIEQTKPSVIARHCLPISVTNIYRSHCAASLPTASLLVTDNRTAKFLSMPGPSQKFVKFHTIKVEIQREIPNSPNSLAETVLKLLVSFTFLQTSSNTLRLYITLYQNSCFPIRCNIEDLP